MDKTSLRNEKLLLRRALQPSDASKLSQRISHNLKDAVNWSNVRSLHIYTSHTALNEVDTAVITRMISEEYPNIHITKGSPSRHALIPTELYDVIIAPLIVFDNSCHRIGFGGGWYDRFLSMQPKAQKIGLAYSLQHVKYIPAERHDEALDMVITEKRIYMPNKNALRE